MQEIWYKNKPTLIKALVTLVLFMVLSNVAKGIRGDHENALQIHEEKVHVCRFQNSEGRALPSWASMHARLTNSPKTAALDPQL